MKNIGDAKIQTGIVKYDKTSLEDKKIDITVKDITSLLGLEISREDILEVFRKLDFKVESDGENLKVFVPRRRIDISIKEDLIEEVGRIYGVDNIVGKLPKFSLKPGNYNKKERAIRNKMIDLGLNEVLSYILINDKEVKKYTTDEFEAVKLLDPMTEERNTLRYSIIPSLVKIYEYNSARNLKDISIFEIGKGFYKKEEYGEETKICALMAGKYGLGINNAFNVDFYVLKGIVEELLDHLGYEKRYSFITNKEIPEEFHPYQTALISVNNDVVGIMGRLHPNLQKEPVYVMEINLDKLLDKKVGKMKFKELSKFPGIKKDIAVIVEKDINAEEVASVIKKAGGSLLTNIELFDLYTGKGIEENKKSLAYSLTFEDNKKTLTDEEVNTVMGNIIELLTKKLKAELRK